MKTFKEYQTEEIKITDLPLRSYKDLTLDGVNFTAERLGDMDVSLFKSGKHLGTLSKVNNKWLTGGPKGKQFDSLELAMRGLLSKNKIIKEEVLQEAFFGEYGEIANKKKFNPENPEILVKGVGRYTLESLKKNIAGKLADLADRAEKDQFAFINEMLNEKSILTHFVKAVLDVEKELKTPNIKRKITLMKKEAAAKDLKKKILKEVSPPDKEIEDWILKNKKRFVQEYGKQKGIEVLYGRAWNMYNNKKR